jgi:DNA-binding NarL/FixJ family response regulator
MNLLLIDDHVLVRQAIRAHLLTVDPEFNILDCSSPDTAMALIQRPEPKIDLILLDLTIPGYKDVESLLRLRKIAPDVPVVVLSANEDPDVVRRCIDQGAYGYVHKSSDIETLVAGLQTVLSGGVFLPAISVSAFQTAHPPTARSRNNKQLLASFTERQMDVLRCMVVGMTNKNIAKSLGLGDGTIKTHVANIMNTMGVENRTQVVFELSRRGIKLPQPVIPVEPPKPSEAEPG